MSVCEVNHAGHGQATDSVVCPQGTALAVINKVPKILENRTVFFGEGEEGCVQLGTGGVGTGSGSWGLLAATCSAL